MKIFPLISTATLIFTLSCKNSKPVANENASSINSKSVDDVEFNVHNIEITQSKPFIRSWQLGTLAFSFLDDRELSEKINKNLNDINDYCFKIDDEELSEQSIKIMILSDRTDGSIYSRKLTKENFSIIYHLLSKKPIPDVMDMEELNIIYRETLHADAP